MKRSFTVMWCLILAVSLLTSGCMAKTKSLDGTSGATKKKVSQTLKKSEIQWQVIAKEGDIKEKRPEKTLYLLKTEKSTVLVNDDRELGLPTTLLQKRNILEDTYEGYRLVGIDQLSQVGNMTFDVVVLADGLQREAQSRFKKEIEEILSSHLKMDKINVYIIYFDR